MLIRVRGGHLPVGEVSTEVLHYKVVQPRQHSTDSLVGEMFQLTEQTSCELLQDKHTIEWGVE